MLLGFNDSKCTAYAVDSARGLMVIWIHLVLASAKLVLQKEVYMPMYKSSKANSFAVNSEFAYFQLAKHLVKMWGNYSIELFSYYRLQTI